MTKKDCEVNELLPSVTGMELWPLIHPLCHIFQIHCHPAFNTIKSVG